MPPAMENSLRTNQPSLIRISSRHKQNGYEPSDTETEWQESPWNDGLLLSNRLKTPHASRTISPISNRSHRSKTPNPSRIISLIPTRSKTPNPSRTSSPISSSSKILDPARTDSPLNYSQRDANSSNRVRRHTRSPYKPNRRGEHVAHFGRITSPLKAPEQHNDTSPYRVYEHRNTSPYKAKHVSPYRTRESEIQEVADISELSHNEIQEISRVSVRSNHNRTRSISSAKERKSAPRVERSPSPLAKTMVPKELSQNEINETIANEKLAKSPKADILMQSTESISLSDIFVSHNCTKETAIKNSDEGNKFVQNLKSFPEKNGVNQTPQGVSASTVLSQTNNSTSSAFGRSSNGRSTTYSGKFSDSSKLSGSLKKNIAIRNKSQTDTWLSCVRGGSCTKTKSPDSRAIDEASFIGRALVVEELKPFWADKHTPHSLSKFICHKQQTQSLKQLISHSTCPHILFRGPSGSGKKSLSMALLHDIFGDSSWKTSDALRHFHVQESRAMQIAVPVTSSRHHVEINLKSSNNAGYALMALVKEMMDDQTHSPDVSDVSFIADYKVIILCNFDKVADNIQHLIKWIMDRYTNSLKIILCCEDGVDIIDSVKTRCKLISVDAPVTAEIMEVLVEIAKKENFELPVSFAARIATKSKQNLRKAIMALEACRLHNYPFVDEQPIPLGWEDVVIEVAEEILTDPSSKRLFLLRGKFQKLLVEFVHPKLILHKLVELFLKRVEPELKRELYYWHGYYEKKFPVGTSALLKLEEFVAKFMSIYRKSSSSRSQFV